MVAFCYKDAICANNDQLISIFQGKLEAK